MFAFYNENCVVNEKEKKVKRKRFRKKTLLFFLGFGLIIPSALFSEGLPEWIYKEGIRAGYLYAQHDPSNFSVLQNAGLNSVIIKEWRFRNDLPIQSVYHWPYSKRASLSKWGPYLKKNGIRLFLGFNWNAHPSYPYRRAVFDDGQSDNAPCPQDQFLWKKYLLEIVKEAVYNAAHNQFDIDGIWLDFELYFATESRRNYYRSYHGKKVCYCEYCFRNFIFSKGLGEEKFNELKNQDRYLWVTEGGRLREYQNEISLKIELLATEFARAVHKVKPGLVIGMYPSVFIEDEKSDWVLQAIARGLGNKENPLLLFETTTYGYFDRKGHSRIPDDFNSAYEKLGIDGKFVAGYLLRMFSPEEIEDNIYFSNKKALGYWLFRLPTLWKEFGMEKDLYSGNPEDYLRAIKRANKKVIQENEIKVMHRNGR